VTVIDMVSTERETS